MIVANDVASAKAAQAASRETVGPSPPPNQAELRAKVGQTRQDA